MCCIFCINYIYIYAFSRCFYPKRLTGYTFILFFYQYVILTYVNIIIPKMSNNHSYWDAKYIMLYTLELENKIKTKTNLQLFCINIIVYVTIIIAYYYTYK